MIEILLVLAASTLGADDVGWDLGVSDVAVYDQRIVTMRDGKERRGRKTIFTVSGHDLRDDGQYSPVWLQRGDLPALLAMRLPPAGERMLDLFDVVPIKVRGVAETSREEGGPVTIRARYVFGSRGSPKGFASWIRNGEATVTSVFDPEVGAIVRSRIEMSYALGETGARVGERATNVNLTRTYRLLHVRRARYDGFQADVDRAIDAGAKRLRELQKEDGSFPPHGNHTFGTSALAAFTLASCDAGPDDPALVRAFAFLRRSVPDRTYAQALCLLALDRAYTPAHEVQRERAGKPVEHRRDLPPELRAWGREVAEALERGARSPGEWGYPTTNPRSLLKSDMSNTQYAVLGMRAAERLGFPVKESTWLGVVRTFQQVREREGPRGSIHLQREGERDPGGDDTVTGDGVPKVAGFRYARTAGYERAWGSMTCAAIACLSVARERLRLMDSRRLDRRMERDIDEMILGAWAWMDAHWGTGRHPGKTGEAWHLYFLYSLERAAVLTRVKRVGGKDWYFEGAIQILARQEKNGGWKHGRGGETVSSCFALLFLKRATAPITPSPR
jgi:hypothetical protein